MEWQFRNDSPIYTQLTQRLTPGGNATLHEGKCHTWDMLRCGIRGAEVWHSER